MISVVAQSARFADGKTTAVDPDARRERLHRCHPLPARVARRGRSEARPGDRHVLDLHGRARAQRLHVRGPVVASTGADCGAALSSAVGALSGPLHGGAPARVLPMLDGAAAADSIEAYVKDLLDAGDRLMGFGHRVYRAEDPRSRLLRGTAMDLGSPRFEVAEELERVALAELHARKPDRVLATNVEFWSAVVLDVADVPPRLAPAMFACSRTAGWSAHVMEQKRLGRLVRPSAVYVGPGPTSRCRSPDGSLAGRSARRRVRHSVGRSASSRRFAASGRTRSRRLPGTATTGCGRSPTGRSRSSASARSSSCFGAGSRTRARPCEARR